MPCESHGKRIEYLLRTCGEIEDVSSSAALHAIDKPGARRALSSYLQRNKEFESLASELVRVEIIQLTLCVLRSFKSISSK